VKSNKQQTTALAEQATRWLQTLVNSLNDAKADRSEMERMEPYTNQMFQYVLVSHGRLLLTSVTGY
jgi:hypothetical protein